MKTKIKWKVSPKSTGRYASFQARGWPHAEYECGQWAAQLICKEDYSFDRAKSGNHSEIKVMIADYTETQWVWRTLVKRASTLEEAKEIVKNFLIANPQYAPRAN